MVTSGAGDRYPRTWVEIVSNVSGIRFHPSPVPKNDPVNRVEAVPHVLNDNPGGAPGLLLCPTCQALRRGFNSGYRCRRLKITNRDMYDEKPDKSRPESHPHHALQYFECGTSERSAVLGRKQDVVARAAHGQIRAIDEDYPEDLYARERRSRRERQGYAIE